MQLANTELLLQAAEKGNAAVIQALVAQGADVNAKSNVNWTSLHHAAFKGKTAAVKELVAVGADVDSRDSNGYTPLHESIAHYKFTSAIGVLIANGADINAASDSGCTPLGVARLTCNPEIIKALIAEGAQ